MKEGVSAAKRIRLRRRGKFSQQIAHPHGCTLVLLGAALFQQLRNVAWNELRRSHIAMLQSEKRRWVMSFRSTILNLI